MKDVLIDKGDNLLRVVIVDKKRNTDLIYKEYSKSFWNGTTLEGFYDHFDWAWNSSNAKAFSAQELRDGAYQNTLFIVENKIAYYRPYVKLVFKENLIQFHYFNSYKEAEEWGMSISRSYISHRIIQDENVYP